MAHLIYHYEGIGPKTITVPPNQTWRMISGHIVLTTSAIGGNRRVHMTARTIGDSHPVWDCHAGVNQGPSKVNEYHLRQGDNRDTQFTDDDVIVTIPQNALLMTGMELLVRETNQIDEANDSFLIHFNYSVAHSLNPRAEQLL